jgi:hypothetical protein
MATEFFSAQPNVIEVANKEGGNNGSERAMATATLPRAAKTVTFEDEARRKLTQASA